ncbi:hypothetical protein [Nostoc sp. LPT]|uniref:hypothetical protein n=1 Tax=Nostoc sp. LPT TaxID=2815387 RepID=UPI001DC35DB0|nr:hypothetical protein [Nostoc sp. LPT]MBN4004689.1 hypothetical protein [Nostoc sp. LPT]
MSCCSLRSEYDLKSLRIRKFGPERKSFGKTKIPLEPDVAEVSPNADAVNEALSTALPKTVAN